MKVGSLVVVLPFDNSYRAPNFTINWLPIDNGEEIYTVRGFNSTNDGVSFEEGCMGYWIDGPEVHLDVRHVREIQPPMEVNIEELISELV